MLSNSDGRAYLLRGGCLGRGLVQLARCEQLGHHDLLHSWFIYDIKLNELRKQQMSQHCKVGSLQKGELHYECWCKIIYNPKRSKINAVLTADGVCFCCCVDREACLKEKTHFFVLSDDAATACKYPHLHHSSRSKKLHKGHHTKMLTMKRKDSYDPPMIL